MIISAEYNLPRPQTVPPIPTFQKSKTTLFKENQWREKVSNDIKTNHQAINQSDKHILYSKIDDPLTNLREVLAKLSNNEAFKYMRQCRLIVAKLRKCWVDLNEEMKPLTKTKEYLESAIEHIRKDIITTQETIDNRVHRSIMEPNPDTVDNNLAIEKQNYLGFKKNLETILKPVQEQLLKLDSTREAVFKLCKERAVVTDLICQCLTQTIRAYDRNATKARSSLIDTKLTKNNTSLFASQSFNQNNHELGGPLSAFTEEPLNIFKEASQDIAESRELRNQSKILMKEAFENIKTITKMVNDAFFKKIEETLQLSKNLCVSGGENQLAINRAVRWQDLNTMSYKYTLGPEKNTNLNLNERFDRPIIKNFQKHPGNQVPEAQEIQKGTDALKESVKISENHIKTLKVIGQRLDANQREKEAAYALDASLLRRRRELVDHRWVPVSYVKEK